MTREEKIVIINEIVGEVNVPVVRALVTLSGRSCTLAGLVKDTLTDNYPELLPRQVDDIIEEVEKLAIHSQYPLKKMERLSNKLELKDILFLADLNKQDICRSLTTLESILQQMDEHGDEVRAEEIRGSVAVLQELLNGGQS